MHAKIHRLPPPGRPRVINILTEISATPRRLKALSVISQKAGMFSLSGGRRGSRSAGSIRHPPLAGEARRVKLGSVVLECKEWRSYCINAVKAGARSPGGLWVTNVFSQGTSIEIGPLGVTPKIDLPAVL